jgi:CubicO group peptidase (beta-lactamase class C family)
MALGISIGVTAAFGVVHAQPSTASAVAAGAIDAEIRAQIDEIFADLDSIMSPGCAVGVIQDQRLVYSRGYGMASLEHGVPIDENTVFYTGSVSKQFTAAAVAMAAREGYLSLDDDIRKWFPELPDYGEPMTVRHLVHHTSGVSDYLGLMAMAGIPFENVIPAERVVDMIARQRALNFMPGEEYLYSNSGYFLLAQLVGRATDGSLRAYADEKFFQPLGMRHTHFHDDRREVVDNRALAYAPSPGGFVVEWSPAFEQVGSGGLLSTIEDFVEWDRSYYDGRLGDGFWESMEQRGVLDDGEELNYAFGLNIGQYRGHRRVEHGGAMFGYRAHLARYPEQQLSVAILCNLASANPGQWAQRVADLFLPPGDETASGSNASERGDGSDTATAAEAEPVDLTRRQLDAWVGDYEDEAGLSLGVTRQDGGLVVAIPAISVDALTLVPLSESAFRAVDAPPQIPDSTNFRFGETDGEASLAIEMGGNVVATLIRAAERATEMAELEAWTGSYRSDELSVVAQIALDGDRLTYQIGASNQLDLTVRRDGSFSMVAGRGRGEPGAGGRIGTFVLNAGRVRGLRFERVQEAQ